MTNYTFKELVESIRKPEKLEEAKGFEKSALIFAIMDALNNKTSIDAIKLQSEAKDVKILKPGKSEVAKGIGFIELDGEKYKITIGL